MPDEKTNVIIEELLQLISQVSRIEKGELMYDVRVREELGIDSLMAMEIVATIEKRFDIRIDESILNSINTVGDFLDYVISLIKGKHV